LICYQGPTFLVAFFLRYFVLVCLMTEMVLNLQMQNNFWRESPVVIT